MSRSYEEIIRDLKRTGTVARNASSRFSADLHIPTKRYTYLNAARTHRDYDADQFTIKAGFWYIMEIVRPTTPDLMKRYSMDGCRIVNGVYRIVSTQKMYVQRVVYQRGCYELDCYGRDNYGSVDKGVYRFYQTPDLTNKHDIFILSIKRC